MSRCKAVFHHIACNLLNSQRNKLCHPRIDLSTLCKLVDAGRDRHHLFHAVSDGKFQSGLRRAAKILPKHHDAQGGKRDFFIAHKDKDSRTQKGQRLTQQKRQPDAGTAHGLYQRHRQADRKDEGLKDTDPGGKGHSFGGLIEIDQYDIEERKGKAQCEIAQCRSRQPCNFRILYAQQMGEEIRHCQKDGHETETGAKPQSEGADEGIFHGAFVLLAVEHTDDWRRGLGNTDDDGIEEIVRLHAHI